MKDLVVYGSRAIKHHFPNFKREPDDWDFLINSPSFRKSDIYKIEYKYVPPVVKYLDYINFDGEICPPDVLCTIKASHLFWDIKWDKNFGDLMFLLKNGCSIIESLFYELYEFWKTKHGNNRRSDLKMNKEDFFKNKINYEIDHDYIHTILNPTPVYTKILKDGADVEVDGWKFQRLYHSEKVDLVKEEVMVMAWERGRKTGDYFKSYTWMYKRFFMHHAPIWEALFMLRNWKILCVPDFDYFKKIEDELQRNPRMAKSQQYN